MEKIERKRELTITTGLVRRNGRENVEILIKDTGAGIPEGDVDKIFEPFFSTKEVGKGTGLGLSICYGIIEAHGGQIEVESRIDEGTTLRIILPVLKDPLRPTGEWTES
jgi:two-component system NtrC family sensor kinase